MFDSLSAGYLPICLIVLALAWFIAKVPNNGLRVVLGVIIPVMVAFGWFFVPRLSKLFGPLKYGEDPWVGWGLITATTWSIVAEPLGIISVVIFAFGARRRKQSSS